MRALLKLPGVAWTAPIALIWHWDPDRLLAHLAFLVGFFELRVGAVLNVQGRKNTALVEEVIAVQLFIIRREYAKGVVVQDRLVGFNELEESNVPKPV